MQEDSQTYFHLAYDYQMKGEFDTAISLYLQSLALQPTPEAHTFLGWTYSFQERYDEAIAECHKAIALDPEYGNPYNDIGSYLMILGHYDEAIHWFEKALQAPRYEARVYPHFNLGRVYELKFAYSQALQCYLKALQIDPDYQPAYHALIRLNASMN